MKSRLVLIIVFVFMSCSVFGFDGDRKGFVIGGGLGIAPLIESSVEGLSSESKSKFGVGSSVFLGYALDENNVIVLLSERAMYRWSLDNDTRGINSQGFLGPALFHYFSDPGESGFMIVGIGFQNAEEATERVKAGDADIGFLIGGGYEFLPHLQLQVTMSYGQTKYQQLPINHRQIVVSLTAVAF